MRAGTKFKTNRPIPCRSCSKRTSGKDVILTAIHYRGTGYVMDNISELAEKSLITEKYAKSIVRGYVLGNIEIKKGNSK